MGVHCGRGWLLWQTVPERGVKLVAMKELALPAMRRNPALGDPLAKRSRWHTRVGDRLLHQHPRTLPLPLKLLSNHVNDAQD